MINIGSITKETAPAHLRLLDVAINSRIEANAKLKPRSHKEVVAYANLKRLRLKQIAIENALKKGERDD